MRDRLPIFSERLSVRKRVYDLPPDQVNPDQRRNAKTINFGLIYGMGHAVYTLSDPRAKILKAQAGEFAAGTEFEDEFKLLGLIERLTPEIFSSHKSSEKSICANVDLYSGIIYKMLDIPPDLFTPIFTIARIAGWSAHRIEELLTGGRIIRPAYKSNTIKKDYIPINDR